MVQETKTAPPSSPPAESPFTPAPVELADQQPQAEPRHDEVLAADSEGVTVEAKPWGHLEPGEALEHDEFRPLLEDRDKATYDRAYSDVHSRIGPNVLRQKEAAESAAAAMEEIRITLTRSYEDGVLDKRAAEDLFRQHRAAFEAMNGLHRATGVSTALSYIARDMGLTVSPIVEMGYNDWAAGKGTLDFLKDFAADMKAKVAKDEAKVAEDKGYRRGLKEGEAALAAKMKAQAEGGPVVAAAKGGGSGRPTPAEYNAATREQRAKWQAEGIEPLT